uniref:proline-rich protein 2-like n=1 Tax=Euleptes europaea TaxID=460621 RepID=UPI0025416094|nr:proline-rich protein 2-like [Euleptes europaea]
MGFLFFHEDNSQRESAQPGESRAKALGAARAGPALSYISPGVTVTESRPPDSSLPPSAFPARHGHASTSSPSPGAPQHPCRPAAGRRPETPAAPPPAPLATGTEPLRRLSLRGGRRPAPRLAPPCNDRPTDPSKGDAAGQKRQVPCALRRRPPLAGRKCRLTNPPIAQHGPNPTPLSKRCSQGPPWASQLQARRREEPRQGFDEVPSGFGAPSKVWVSRRPLTRKESGGAPPKERRAPSRPFMPLGGAQGEQVEKMTAPPAEKRTRLNTHERTTRKPLERPRPAPPSSPLAPSKRSPLRSFASGDRDERGEGRGRCATRTTGAGSPPPREGPRGSRQVSPRPGAGGPRGP